jgi:hypothetical protein
MLRLHSAWYALALLIGAASAFAQDPPPTPLPAVEGERVPDESEMVKLPTGVILIKGAEPSASDSKTPLPESGQVVKGAYRNEYFGLTWSLPADWSENYAGPPPSDSGMYVLALAGPSPKFKGTSRATLLIQAHDLFFSPSRARNAMELAMYAKETLEPFYVAERSPVEVRIANRAFARFDYKSEAAGLHWVVLTTAIRCHAVQFILTSSDVDLLESLIKDLDHMQLPPEAQPEDMPVCLADYATGKNVTNRVDPVMNGKQKFNPIPVRIVIDERGRVRHIHLISAFPEQAASITQALTQWTFKPYEVNGERVEVETGLMFGYEPPWPKRDKGAAAEVAAGAQ